jgi:hypothetical protein
MQCLPQIGGGRKGKKNGTRKNKRTTRRKGKFISLICQLAEALGTCKAYIEISKQQIDGLDKKISEAIKLVGLNPDAKEFKISEPPAFEDKGQAQPATGASPKLLSDIEGLANQVRNCSHLKCQMLAERINAVVAQLRT